MKKDEFDAGVAELRGNDANLRNDLNSLQFASIVGKHHPSAVLAVEAFIDPGGSVAYQQRLGQKRADAGRNYLIQAGMDADKVRAVSYGKAANRQIAKGNTKDGGASNRRVVLVVERASQAS